MGEMENEIYIIDEHNTEHRVRYIDENRVTVQTLTRIVSEYGHEDFIRYSMPCKVTPYQIASFPYTAELKMQIKDFHAQFPDAK